MLIFDSDDNDDDLNFDGKPAKTPPTPPASSLPTRPKSPFGAIPDQVDASVPEKKAEFPPRKPSPFGQNVPSKPQRPQVSSSADKRTEPAEVTDKVAPQTPAPVTPPAVPNFSSYLPPARKAEPVVEKEYKEEPSEPALSEAELFLRSMKELAEERSQEAKKAEEEARKTAETVNILTPTPVAVPEVQPVEPTVTPEKKQKKGFFTPPPKNPKAKTPAKAPRENKYEGERKKVLYIRLVAGSVAAIIAIAGVQAIFMPNSGPTKDMVMSAAKEAVNYTGFPTVSGEQFSLDFTKAYFNFDSSENDETRSKSLERFASPDLVKQIDIAILSSQEYESVKKGNQPYSDYTVSQSITYGPYVVATKNLTEKAAVFTVKVGLKTGNVVYLDVPVKYDPDNYSLTLAGPPSFSKPIQNQGKAEKDEWTSTFEGGVDDTIQKSFQPDLEAYLSAWALSDSTIVNRYLLDSATDNAKRGLQSAVKFKSIIDLKVEPLSDSRPSTATSRRVEVNVMWEDPKSGLRYPQQYRMLIGKNAEDKWAIYDIENFSVLN